MNREIEILQLLIFQWLILPTSVGINCPRIITHTLVQSFKKIYFDLSPCGLSLHFLGSRCKDNLISHLQGNFIWIVILHFHLKMGIHDIWGAQIAMSQLVKSDCEDLIRKIQSMVTPLGMVCSCLISGARQGGACLASTRLSGDTGCCWIPVFSFQRQTSVLAKTTVVSHCLGFKISCGVCACVP